MSRGGGYGGGSGGPGAGGGHRPSPPLAAPGHRRHDLYTVPCLPPVGGTGRRGPRWRDEGTRGGGCRSCTTSRSRGDGSSPCGIDHRHVVVAGGVVDLELVGAAAAAACLRPHVVRRWVRRGERRPRSRWGPSPPERKKTENPRGWDKTLGISNSFVKPAG